MRTSALYMLAIAGICAVSADRPALAQPQSGTTVFHQARVFDGSRSIGVRDVLISGGRIVAVAARIPAPAGATVVEGAGATLMPGLIDSHAHAYGDALQQALIWRHYRARHVHRSALRGGHASRTAT